METGFRFGFILVALGFAVGALARASPADASPAAAPPRDWLGHLPTLLIGGGAAILGGSLALWLGASVLNLADAGRFEPSALARGLGPAALVAVAVGAAAGFATPGVRRWTWGLLASIGPLYLAGGLWLLFLVGPEAVEAARMFAQEEGIDAGGAIRSVWTLLAIITAYPIVTLLGATGGAAGGARLAGVLALTRMRRRAASVPGGRVPVPIAGEAGVASDRTDEATWRLVHVAGGSCRVFDGPEELTLLEMTPWTSRGGFQLGDAYYRIDARRLGRILTLETWGQTLARAEVGLARRGARILFEDRELSLGPGFALAPLLGTLLVEESGRRIGRLEPRRSSSADGAAELPRDLPLKIRLFTTYAALVLWRTWSVSHV